MKPIRKGGTGLVLALFAAALAFGATQAAAEPGRVAAAAVCEVFAEGGSCLGGGNSDCADDCLALYPTRGGAHTCRTRPDGACCTCVQ